jgi:hypothetical protein
MTDPTSWSRRWWSPEQTHRHGVLANGDFLFLESPQAACAASSAAFCGLNAVWKWP